jgi:hypothetical protein
MHGQRQYRINFEDVLGRLVKYLVEGLVVAVAAYSIPSAKLDVSEIVTIGLVAAAVLSVLDTLSPQMGSSARMGSGLVIGANLAGGFTGTSGPRALRH